MADIPSHVTINMLRPFNSVLESSIRLMIAWFTRKLCRQRRNGVKAEADVGYKYKRIKLQSMTMPKQLLRPKDILPVNVSSIAVAFSMQCSLGVEKYKELIDKLTSRDKSVFHSETQISGELCLSGFMRHVNLSIPYGPCHGI